MRPGAPVTGYRSLVTRIEWLEPLPPPTVEAIPVLAFTPVAPAVTTLSAQGATQVPATRSPFAATGQPPVARTATSAPPRANSAAGTSGGGSASGTPEGHIPVSIPVAAPARPAFHLLSVFGQIAQQVACFRIVDHCPWRDVDNEVFAAAPGHL